MGLLLYSGDDRRNAAFLVPFPKLLVIGGSASLCRIHQEKLAHFGNHAKISAADNYVSG
jgi:hypothetical protein